MIVRLAIVVIGVVSATGLMLVIALGPQWIEAILGIDPDGGSGLLEMALVAVPVLTGVAVFAAAYRRRLPRDRSYGLRHVRRHPGADSQIESGGY